MASLKCEVTNCQHNCDRLCGLNEIEVSGAAANKSESTCCSSFRESDGSAMNAVHDAVPETSINCSAESCQHNENCKCHADGVDICGNGAKERENTLCDTFISK